MLTLNKVNPLIRDWFGLIDQARRTPEGAIVPSFLEIVNQISSELTEILKNEIGFEEITLIFVGISIISYLNERYAIEKVMMFAKGRCRVSLSSPAELSSQLITTFSERLEAASITEWIKAMGTSMLNLLNKDLQGARDTCLALKQIFKEKFENQNLTLIEGILFCFLKNDLIPLIQKNLNHYQAEFADDPIFLYFSILKNVMNEIQDFQHQKKSGLQGLKNLLDNLSKLE